MTNFDVENLGKIIPAAIYIKTIQLQYLLLDRSPEKLILDYAMNNDIKFLYYETLAGVFFIRKVAPKILENRSLAKYKFIIEDDVNSIN